MRFGPEVPARLPWPCISWPRPKGGWHCRLIDARRPKLCSKVRFGPEHLADFSQIPLNRPWRSLRLGSQRSGGCGCGGFGGRPGFGESSRDGGLPCGVSGEIDVPGIRKLTGAINKSPPLCSSTRSGEGRIALATRLLPRQGTEVLCFCPDGYPRIESIKQERTPLATELG